VLRQTGVIKPGGNRCNLAQIQVINNGTPLNIVTMPAYKTVPACIRFHPAASDMPRRFTPAGRSSRLPHLPHLPHLVKPSKYSPPGSALPSR
jgi:hypothetical protein